MKLTLLSLAYYLVTVHLAQPEEIKQSRGTWAHTYLAQPEAHMQGSAHMQVSAQVPLPQAEELRQTLYIWRSQRHTYSMGYVGMG